ncbi:MAG: hypothetical protein OES84_00590 [Kiritimatiellaceae bacterium]|nr:hypothetical protein [Kiritimatiellaceae bacterium]
MKKAMLAIIMFVICANVFGGQIGLPLERLAIPSVDGSHLVCVWDESAGTWLKSFEIYNHSGSYDFQLPEWGKWYWVGLWDEASNSYVFSKWIGHFPAE